MEQFIGSNKILTVSLTDKKTPADGEFVKITFEDGKVEEMPKKRFELLVTQEVSDATKSTFKLIDSVNDVIYAMLIEYGIKISEVNLLIERLTGKVNTSFGKGSTFLWGAEYNDLTLNKVNDVLLEKNDTEQQSKTE